MQWNLLYHETFLGRDFQHCAEFLVQYILKHTLLSRKLQSWNRWSLGLGMCISLGLSLIGNFQLHSHRTSGRERQPSKLEVSKISK